MTFGHSLEVALGRALGNVHAGPGKLASRKLDCLGLPKIEVTSPAFEAGQRLPTSATVDGPGHAPPLAWSGLPDDTLSIVILCEDADAPLPEPFVHWLVYDVPPTVRAMTEAQALACAVGKSSKMSAGFAPAAPPAGHGVHHYHFQVFALDWRPELEPGLGRHAVLDKMRGHVAAFGEIVGYYERE